MVKYLLAGAALAVAYPAFAASESISKVDTANGEVLLEIQGNGVSMQKLASISSSCNLTGFGEKSRDSGLQAGDKAKRDLQDALRSQGLKTVSLDFSAPMSLNLSVDYGSAAYAGRAGAAVEAAAAAAMDAAAEADTAAASDTAVAGAVVAAQKEPDEKYQFSQIVRISAASTADYALGLAVAKEVGCEEVYSSSRNPDIQLVDADGGSRAAIANAMDDARKQADIYAATLNMRVVRILRVSNVGMIKELFGTEVDKIMSEMLMGRNRDSWKNDSFPINKSVMIDFALGPK